MVNRLMVVDSEEKGRDVIGKGVVEIAVWGNEQLTDVLFVSKEAYDALCKAHPYLIAPLTRGKGDLEHPLYDDPLSLIVEIFESTKLITVVK